MKLKGLRPLFYTRAEVEEFLTKVLIAVEKWDITSAEVFSELPKMGFTIRSMANNSFDVKYYGSRFLHRISFTKLRGKELSQSEIALVTNSIDPLLTRS